MDPHIVIDQSRDWVDIATLIFGAAGLAVVTTYTILTYRLLGTTRAALAETQKSNAAAVESNRIAARGMELARLTYLDEHRPLIRATGVTAEGSDREVVAEVHFKNRGKAAAADVEFSGDIAVGDENFDPTTFTLQGYMYYPHGNQMSATIGPGEEVSFLIRPSGDTNLTREELERIAKEGRILYVFGHVHPWYDPFKARKEHLYFCYYRDFGRNPLRAEGETPIWMWARYPNNVLEYEKTMWESQPHDPAADKKPTLPNPPDFPLWRV